MDGEYVLQQNVPKPLQMITLKYEAHFSPLIKECLKASDWQLHSYFIISDNTDLFLKGNLLVFASNLCLKMSL